MVIHVAYDDEKLEVLSTIVLELGVVDVAVVPVRDVNGVLVLGRVLAFAITG
jgi:hypothetical protein